MMLERRKSKRWRINQEVKIKFEGAEVFTTALLMDINFKGLQICIKQRLPSDTSLKFKLILDEEFILETEAWQIWCRNIKGNYLYGLYFTKISDIDKEKIYKFIQKYLPEALNKVWYEKEGGGKNMQDRRIFQRFPVKTKVRYLISTKNSETEAETVDISAKGLGLITSQEIKPYVPLELWIVFPNKAEPFYTRGEVVWSKQISPGRYRTGVELEKAEFINLSALTKKI